MVNRKSGNNISGTIKTEYMAMVILSILFFGALDVDGIIYFLIAVSFWTLVLVRYIPGANKEFYSKGTILAVLNFLIYFALKVLLKRYVFSFSRDAILLSCYAIFLVIFGVVNVIRRSGQTNNENPIELFEERCKDVQQIRKYLDRFSSIGIEGVWGSGKTILMDHITDDPELKEKYIFITIHLLSVDFDKVQDIIIREIGKALDSNRIFSSGVSGMLRWMKDDGWAGRFLKLFIPDGSTYTDALTNIKNDVKRLGYKRIVIIYEDIDRVQNTENIRQIFSLSENLAGSSIKFIYEFDEDCLQSLDNKFSRDYIEKYIPHVIRLTPISVKHIFEMACKEKNLKHVCMKDLKFLFGPIPVDNRLRKSLNAPELINFNMTASSIRKVNIFLEEVDAAFEDSEDYREEKNKQPVITYFVMKHFFYDIYKGLDFYNDTSLTDQLLLTTGKDDASTIMHLLLVREAEQRVEAQQPPVINSEEDQEEVNPDINLLTEKEDKDIWDNEDNREILLLLSMFGYHFDTRDISFRTQKSLSAIANEDGTNLKNRTRNNEIDRLIRSLNYHGKSSMTDPKFVYRKMCSEVFIKTQTEWSQAYNELKKQLFNDAFEYEDNHTIFRIGVSPMLQLFKAFDVSYAREKDWLNLLEFYFEQVKTENGILISEGFLQPLNFVDLKYRSVYLSVLRTFNEGVVVGNLNKSQTYHNFLDNYLTAIAYLGFIDTGECEYLRYFPDSLGEEVEWRVFDPLKKRLERQKSVLSFSQEIVDAVNVILAFIEKNRTLYKADKKAPIEPDNIHFDVSMQEVLEHQTTVDRLLAENKDEKSLKKAMLEEFDKGELTPYEMERLMNIFRKGQN